MAATLEDAIRQSIKMYWKNTKDFDELGTSKERKYSKKYFDSIEEEFISKKDQIDKKQLEDKGGY